jgi:hypothetical protein
MHFVSMTARALQGILLPGPTLQSNIVTFSHEVSLSLLTQRAICIRHIGCYSADSLHCSALATVGYICRYVAQYPDWTEWALSIE